MAYRVELTARAERDLRQIYAWIKSDHSGLARTWFNGLEAAIGCLEEYPARGLVVPEDTRLRQLLYGSRPHVYRVIYAIDEGNGTAILLHIRHGARRAFAPDDEEHI